jgi:hypothetical protein
MNQDERAVMRRRVESDLRLVTDGSGAAFRLGTTPVGPLFTSEVVETNGELSPISP